MGINLNFQCSGILPYYPSGNKRITFLFEMKSEDYVPPFFNNSLCFLGGNRGNKKDKSPEAVLERELNEEFHILDEDEEESLNDLIGQEVLKNQQGSPHTLNYDEKTIEDIRRIPSVLLEEKIYAESYLVTFFPPFGGIKRKVKGIESIFVKELSSEEYLFVDNLLKKTDGRVTTDNLKFGGKTLFASLEELNDNRYKFAWDCGQMVTDILKREKVPIPLRYPIAIKSLDGVEIKPIHTTENPTFEEFEHMGYKYGK